MNFTPLGDIDLTYLPGVTLVEYGIGGQYYGASSTSNLASVYKTIADSLKRTWRIQRATTGDTTKTPAGCASLIRLTRSDSTTQTSPCSRIPARAKAMRQLPSCSAPTPAESGPF